ncbi:MAG: signal peptide peptidase SppA [Tepidisphaeraceae bacterium]|jgi:protease-4
MTLRTVAVLCLAAFLAAACAAAKTAGAADAPATLPSTQPAASAFPTPADLIAKLKDAKQTVAGPVTPHVAYLELNQAVVEKPSDFSFFASQESLTLRSLLDRLEKARQDKDISAVLLTVGGTGINLSQSLELRDELLALKKAGKRTFVYADSYDGPAYIMASGASDVCLLAGGDIELPGVGLQTLFAKGLLDKVGVEADYEQIGEYKGADEMYIHTQPSPEMAGELQKLVDSLYGELITNISANRHLSPDQVKKIVDQALIPADEAKKDGLVDHIVDIDGLRDLMGDKLGGKIDLQHDYGAAPKEDVDFSSPFALLSFLTRKPAESTRQSVGLIYAEGVIVDGSTDASLFSTSDQIGSDDIRSAMRLAERDDQISAVVIRIDSPGGSALASEAMWQAVRRVARTKPVIISVGSMAASGGYYLATSGNYIYADPTAIVGSIGVVGGKFVLGDLLAKVGLNVATFARGANEGLFDSTTPWTPEQRQMVHDWMQQTYNQFTDRVMTTRKGKIKDIDKVARGRIFLAAQAKDLGLVDAIGGINDAIAYAAQQADMAPDSYDVRVIPAPKTLADIFSGGSDSRINIQPKVSATDSLLDLLPGTDRALLAEQISVLKLFESRPIALVCPYSVRSR